MPKLNQPLTDRQIKTATPETDKKTTKLSDGGGLYLQIEFKQNRVSKLWRLNYRFHGRQKTYSIGAYPSITLSQARSIREELKSLLANGIDPSQKKKEAKQQVQEQQAKKENTFEKISKEWIAFKDGTIKEVTLNKHQSRLDLHIYPYFKDISIDEITAKDIIAFIKDRDRDGVGFETIERCKSLLDNILRYSLNNGYIEFNPVATIKTQEIIKKTAVKHRAQIKDPKRVLELIDASSATYFTKKALQFLPYVFFRNDNIANLKWEYVNLSKKEIVIPQDDMKKRENGDLVMPLSKQALKILKAVQEHSSNDFVFTSPYHNAGLSENTINKAYRKMGLSGDDISSHSWRNLFYTTAHYK